MSSADDSFKPDKIIKAKKGESSWKVAANERTRIMLPHFIDRALSEARRRVASLARDEVPLG